MFTNKLYKPLFYKPIFTSSKDEMVKIKEDLDKEFPGMAEDLDFNKYKKEYEKSVS